MEFIILGPTALCVKGQRIDLGAAKQRGMLGILLYHAGEPVRIDLLVEQLWDDGRSLDDYRANLYALASRIRAALNRVGMGRALVRLNSMPAYRLDVDPNLVDFHRFKRMVAEARQAAGQQHHDTAAALLARATALWTDVPLADLRGAHAEHLRRDMYDAQLEAHKLLAECQLKIGQHQSVLAGLEPFMRTYRFDETLAQHWIAALYAAGRQGDARTFLVDFRRRFRKEMRTEPTITLPYVGERTRLSRTRAGNAATAPRQLPKDISDFTGHIGLLTQLDALTDPDNAETNVVALSGMPGVGKTTLAIHWAHQRRHRFPDGELYLNANAYGTGPRVAASEGLGRFLNALGYPADRMPVSTEDRRDRFNELLAGRRMLIVLDNVGDSDQARPLIPTSSTCVTVITSRSWLRGLTVRDGVRSLTTSPLPDSDCLALLNRLIGPSRAAAEPEAVRALAQLSGGLPLALRIIGVRVAEWPRARIADLVDELSAHLLDSEGEDDEEASLRNAFTWSYKALKADAARMLRMLGLHPASSISPEAAGAMLGIHTLYSEHLLDTLAKAHLINNDTIRRYRFHDLLRLFAAGRAHQEEPGTEQKNAIRRLLDWYVLSAVNAATLLAPDRQPVPDLPASSEIRPQEFDTDLDAMKWREAERANIGAVIRWAAAHGFHRHVWQMASTLHAIYDRYGRQEEVLALYKLALSSAQHDGHQLGEAGTLNNLGATYFAMHNYSLAVEHFEACIQLARSIGYGEAEIIYSHNLATVHLKTDNVAEAVRLSMQVLDACRNVSNPFGEAHALHRLGDAYRLMKQYDQAVSHYLEALATRKRIGSLRDQGATHGSLAAAYLEAGQADLAIEQCRRAMEIHDRTKDKAAHCDTLTTLADAERELAMHQDAVRDALRALAVSEEINDSQRRCHALVVLADTLALSGSTDAARRHCAEALDILKDLTVEPQVRALHKRLHAIAQSLGAATGGSANAEPPVSPDETTT